MHVHVRAQGLVQSINIICLVPFKKHTQQEFWEYP